MSPAVSFAQEQKGTAAPTPAKKDSAKGVAKPGSLGPPGGTPGSRDTPPRTVGSPAGTPSVRKQPAGAKPSSPVVTDLPMKSLPQPQLSSEEIKQREREEVLRRLGRGKADLEKAPHPKPNDIKEKK